MRKSRDCLTLLSIVLLSLVLLTFHVFGKTTITIMSYFDVTAEAEWPAAKALWDAGEKFVAVHPDIEIEWQFVPFGQLVPTIMQQAMVGELPTGIMLDNPDVPYAAGGGVYTELTPLVEDWEPWSDFYTGAQAAGMFEGKIYTVLPWNNNLALYYNKNLFDSLGLTPPETWDQLLQVCAQLAEALEGTGTYPIGFAAVDTEELTFQFEPFLWSNGGSLLELDRPEAVEALQLWVTLLEKGYAPQDVLTWGQGADPLLGNYVAMMVNGPWIRSLLEEEAYPYGIAPLPVPSASEGAAAVVPIGGETLGISATAGAAERDAVWEFIKFFTEPENMAYFSVTAGYVPTRRSATPLAIQMDPGLEVFAKQAEYALPRPPMGGDQYYTEVSAIARHYVQLALTGELTPQDAFSAASAEIRALFPTEKEYQAAANKARELLAKVRGSK